MPWYLLVIYLYIFVVGIVIASFMNVVIYRVPLNISVAKGRSYCPSCNHTLKAIDLVPVFSYMFLGAKCRYCHKSISFRYPFVELCGGIIAVVLFHHFPFEWIVIPSFLIFMILLAMAWIDYDTMIIPNILQLWLIPFIIWIVCLTNDVTLISRLIGMVSVSGFMILMNLIVKNSFGGGDVKLMALCGFLLGWKNTILSMFIAVFIGGIYAVYLLIKKKQKKEAHFAFGPFLVVAIMISYLYGTGIISWYFNLF
ncbi:MAG: prepilin peptidase [Erysipelotrichaceae bacterium]